MIHVIATIELHDGQRDNFLAEMHQVVPLVLEEEGCLSYGPTLDVETNIDAQPAVRPNVVTMVEAWENLEALEAHLIAPHMMEYRPKVKDFVKSVTLQILEPAQS